MKSHALPELDASNQLSWTITQEQDLRVSADPTSVAQRVERDGFAFEPSFETQFSTLEVGRQLGVIEDIPALLMTRAIGVVQQLRPRLASKDNLNQYSGAFGLGAFPLHTDLAHWFRPPRYLILRCISGHGAVKTRIADAVQAMNLLDPGLIRRAIVQPRKSTCLLTVLFAQDPIGIRWDTLFLKPRNEAASRVGALLKPPEHSRLFIRDIVMAEPGDTLVLDNWRMLHGRSAVAESASSRVIERVYLSELHDDDANGS